VAALAGLELRRLGLRAGRLETRARLPME
jgi:hypothetical protein